LCCELYNTLITSAGFAKEDFPALNGRRGQPAYEEKAVVIAVVVILIVVL
jgi:hypothetical protein